MLFEHADRQDEQRPLAIERVNLGPRELFELVDSRPGSAAIQLRLGGAGDGADDQPGECVSQVSSHRRCPRRQHSRITVVADVLLPMRLAADFA
jgi:hypothetical protein